MEKTKFTAGEEEIIVRLDGGYSAHILETEIVFSNWGIPAAIRSLSIDEFLKIESALSKATI